MNDPYNDDLQSPLLPTLVASQTPPTLYTNERDGKVIGWVAAEAGMKRGNIYMTPNLFHIAFDRFLGGTETEKLESYVLIARLVARESAYFDPTFKVPSGADERAARHAEALRREKAFDERFEKTEFHRDHPEVRLITYDEFLPEVFVPANTFPG
jgi:hypothetical protein